MRNIIRILIAAALIFLVEYYFTKKISKAIKNLFPRFPDKNRKLILKIFLTWINLYPLFLIFDWGYAAIFDSYVWVPQNFFFDYVLIYPFWGGLLLVTQCDLFFLIIDVLRLMIFSLWKKYRSKLLPIETKIIILIAVFFLLYIPARIIHDRNAISIRIVEYKKEDLPEALNNFRLILISDIHADRYTDKNRLRTFVNKVNSTNPDLVLVGGDFISNTPNYINVSAEYIGKIKSRCGIYSCVGDHDNWAYHDDYVKSLNAVGSALEKHNIKMIDNGRDSVNVNGAEIEITFATYTYVKRISTNELDSLANLKRKYDLKILLAHQPRPLLLDAALKYNYDLFLAGHTHGGQITFLFPFKNLSPTLIETPYVRGNFHFGNLLMVVTRGLGMSIAPLRYNSTPEITLIIISKK
jgi:uncharacterized protein